MDIMKDVMCANLWVIDLDGSANRPLTIGNRNDSSPRWFPDETSWRGSHVLKSSREAPRYRKLTSGRSAAA